MSDEVSVEDQEFQGRIDAINAKYQQVYDASKSEQGEIEKDAENCLAEFALDVKWDMTRIVFDVPEIKFKLREMKFHFVKTTFKNKTIAKFDVPEFRWEITKIGPIKTKVPKWYTRHVEIKTRIPEFRWDVTSIKTKIPEFFSKRIEIKFHILKIMGLKELNIPCKSAQEKSEAFSKRMETVTASHQREIFDLSSGYLTAKADDIADQIDVTAKAFDQALSEMDMAIAEVQKNNIDPAAIMTDFEGSPVTLTQARQMIVEKKTEAINELAKAHQQVLDAISQLH